MVLVDSGKCSLVEDNPMKAAWWWAVVLNTWQRVKGIREKAAYDVDELCAPKDLWLDNDGIEAWYKERDKARDDKNGVLDDYGR